MNTFPKLHRPFAFWLAQQFLLMDDIQKEDVRPISDREFYSIMVIIAGAILALDIVFHVF
jgi:hypothetical protein